MTKPCSESKTAKRIWKRVERLSVMARTADIQVRASRGRTTQELHREALGEAVGELEGDAGCVSPPGYMQVTFLSRYGCLASLRPQPVTTLGALKWPGHSYPALVPMLGCCRTHMALLAVVADRAVVETTPHLAHFSVRPVWGSLICLRRRVATSARTEIMTRVETLARV